MHMQTLELFSGTKSFSQVMSRHGFKTLTYDTNASLQPDHTIDLLTAPVSLFPFASDILWASPPCEGFSVAAIGKNWNRDGTPKHERAHLAQALVLKTIEIIDARKPTWWFIENPRGMLRKMPFMQNITRHTVTYCQYGDSRMKPTDIWTNAFWWKPRSPCNNGDNCHEAAPRGSRTGTQGINGAKNRGRIPPALFEDIVSQYESYHRMAA